MQYTIVKQSRNLLPRRESNPGRSFNGRSLTTEPRANVDLKRNLRPGREVYF